MTIEENIAAELQQNILSLNFENGKFGASIFVNQELKILPEDEDGINRDLLNWLSLQEAPLKIISSSRSNISALKQCLPPDTNIQLLPSTEFTLFNADELQDEFGVTINPNCFPSNESCYKSLHALLSYLTKTLPEIPKEVSVLLLESSTVVISKSCLHALQIFDYEPHPNMHASHQGFKEGCSIFSLFNQTVSEEGRAKLKKWFHYPINNAQILKSRHDSIEALIQTEMGSFVKSAVNSLKKCIRISVNYKSVIYYIIYIHEL